MKPTLPRKTIAEAVERDLGPVSQWSTVSEGEESQVFGIRLGDEDLILRINNVADDFQKDAFCQKRFAASELPVPEVLSIGAVGQFAYCVSRRAAGVTLQDLPLADLPDVVGPVAGVLRTIAEVPLHETRGYGRFDARGNAEHPSWHDFLASISFEQNYDWKSVETSVGGPWLERHLSLFMGLVPQCPEIRGLVHGDFGSNNVLTDGVNITGVIDWSEALFGDPLYDVANIFFWRPWLACMEAQARYFLECEPQAMGDPVALRCYQLRIGLQQIHEAAKAGSEEDLRWAMARCDALAADLPV
ncbi:MULTISPECIES: phosphotransferase family protein [unclassified Rhizobium]|uniref:phosphotransferase family protein n=1 Tax=unclassified Rhizobium TaxID=2613769 RepID=UPI00380EA45F